MNAPTQIPVGYSRTLRLREMLQSNRLEFLMEAHNGISARIAKEAGYRWVYLDTKAEFAAAIALYSRRGYKETERYNDNAQATIFMRLALD